MDPTANRCGFPRGHARPEAGDSRFTRHFQQAFAAHLARIGQPGELLTDEAVTGTIRVVISPLAQLTGNLPPSDKATRWLMAHGYPENPVIHQTDSVTHHSRGPAETWG